MKLPKDVLAFFAATGRKGGLVRSAAKKKAAKIRAKKQWAKKKGGTK